MLQILAGILHLGNIDFKPAAQDRATVADRNGNLNSSWYKDVTYFPMQDLKWPHRSLESPIRCSSRRCFPAIWPVDPSVRLRTKFLKMRNRCSVSENVCCSCSYYFLYRLTMLAMRWPKESIRGFLIGWWVDRLPAISADSEIPIFFAIRFLLRISRWSIEARATRLEFWTSMVSKFSRHAHFPRVADVLVVP